MNIRQYTSIGNSNTTKKLVKFFVVSYRKLDVARDNSCLLIITSGITGEFENFSGEVLHYCGKINGRSSSNPVSISTFAKKTMDTANWELKSGLG